MVRYIAKHFGSVESRCIGEISERDGIVSSVVLSWRSPVVFHLSYNAIIKESDMAFGIDLCSLEHEIKIVKAQRSLDNFRIGDAACLNYPIFNSLQLL